MAGRLVTLRDLTAEDVNDVHAIIGDPDITKWLSFDARTHEQAVEMVSGVLERQIKSPRTEYYLAVSTAQDGLVGFCRLGLTGVQAGKLGYAIRSDSQGRGYATDACHVMLLFAFSTLGLHRVSAAIGPDNAASIAVVRTLGFAYEGRLRDHVHTNGSWRDSELFSLLEPELTTRGRT